MPRFRSWFPSWRNAPLTVVEVPCVIADVLQPGQFFVAAPLQLAWTGPVEEEVYWEVFHGRVLDQTQTRARQRFRSWHVWDRSDANSDMEPLLSIKWDQAGQRLFVTRSILCHAWEGYADAGGAIQSRATVKRVRELVGAVELADFATTSALSAELAALLFHAVVGASRLPLTSIETPLPAFLLGQLAYCYRDYAGCDEVRRPEDWLDRTLIPVLAPLEQARLLEFCLRNAHEPDSPALGQRFLTRWRASGRNGTELLSALRTMFNEVSLSPYAGLVGSVLAFVGQAVAAQLLTPADEIDFLAHLLRQAGRHLTAFDLVRFHHRGANYPDALLIDEVLRRLCRLLEATPALVISQPADDQRQARVKRLRRRGLRQAWLLRGLYRGHKVPDFPTTPGEHARVWPAAQPRLAEEQIANPAARTRTLFESDGSRDLAAEPIQTALQQSLGDLAHAEEIRELGTALFLDRPFGLGKHPLEPDRTLLFSYEAFSRRMALDRLSHLEKLFGNLADPALLATAAELCRRPDFALGVPWSPHRPAQRPGVVALDDSLLVADDFLFVRSTQRSVRDFLAWYDTTPLELGDVLSPGHCLLLRSDNEANDVRIFDADWKLRAILQPDLSRGFVSRAGTEHPSAGLRATLVGENKLVRVQPRLD